MTLLPPPSSCASAFRAALFGAGAADDVRCLQLDADCWLLKGRLPDALTPSAAERETLISARPVERDYYEMYGKPVAIPRFVRLYSKGPLTVRVSGSDFEAVPLGEDTPAFVERLLASMPSECGYNSVVTNWYPTGGDYIGWHGDREKQIDADAAPIVSVSLGAPRRFQVRDEASHEIVFDELLRDGDCIVMGGRQFQARFKHRLPKMVAKRDGEVAGRINLTCRKYAPHPALAAAAAQQRAGGKRAAATRVDRSPPTKAIRA